jgi:urocanate hydratase
MQSKLFCILLGPFAWTSLRGNHYDLQAALVSIFGGTANIEQPLPGGWSIRDTSQKLTFFTRLSVGQSGYETM